MSGVIEELAAKAASLAAPEIALPARGLAWVKAHVWPILLALAALAAAVALAAFAFDYFSGTKRAVAVAQVASAGNSAMTASGADAVSTVEAQDHADQTTERTVSHAQAVVSAAPDAAAADAAGRSGLCAISRDLCPAAGVQQPVAP